MNSEYGMICSKNVSWKYVQPRLDTVIIKHNEPENAFEIVADCCGAYIPQETLAFLKKQSEADEARNEIRRTQEARCVKIFELFQANIFVSAIKRVVKRLSIAITNATFYKHALASNKTKKLIKNVFIFDQKAKRLEKHNEQYSRMHGLLSK